MTDLRRRWLPMCAVALLLAGCNAGNVRNYTKSADTQHLTDDEARTWHAGKELSEYFQNKGQLYPDARLTAYLQDIADRLYPEFKGTVKVSLVDSPELNAFALPHGRIYLNIGLVARMRNEAQLATVIGHEIGHFTHQHALKKRNVANSAAVTGMMVGLATGVPISGQLLAISAMSGYSQDMEREADRLGFNRIASLGYAPEESSGVFKIMKEEVEALDIDQPFLYSSHPRLIERIETMQQFAAELKHKGTVRNVERFTELTQGLREVVLERYLKTRRYKTLILILENRSLRLRYPDYADFYLAEAYRQRGEEGDAILAEHAYGKAISLAPTYAPSRRGLGLLLMHQKDRGGEALLQFEQYLTLSPDAADRGYIRNYIAKLKD